MLKYLHRTSIILLISTAAGVLPAPGSTVLPPKPHRVASFEFDGSIGRVGINHAMGVLFVTTVTYPEKGRRKDELHVFDLGSNTRLFGTSISNFVAAALAPHGKFLVAGCEAALCLIDTIQGDIQKKIQLSQPGSSRSPTVLSVAVSPNGRLVAAAAAAASGSTRHEILLWDTRANSLDRWEAISASDRLKETFTLRFHGSPPWIPRWVGFSADGALIASVRDDGTVAVWDLEGHMKRTRRLQGSGRGRLEPVFTADGRLLALQEEGNILHIVDINSGLTILSSEVRAPLQTIRKARLLGPREGAYLAVAEQAGLALIDIDTKKVMARLDFDKPIWEVAISEDRAVLALAAQHQVSVWRMRLPDGSSE